MKTIAFFNNKGGVGKTSLVYHLGWKFADLGLRVMLVDLDPQSNVTRMAINYKTEIDANWAKLKQKSIYQSIKTLIEKGTGDIEIFSPEAIEIFSPEPVEHNSRLFILPGDLDLSKVEDELSAQWTTALNGSERALRVVTAFHRVIQQTANRENIDLCLIDIGPNLGAINRCSLIASDFVITPLAPDLFSLQGLENMGPALIKWRKEWAKRLNEKPVDLDFELPTAQMSPLGYIIMRHSVRMDRPVKAYENWMNRIPKVYWEKVLEREPSPLLPGSDKYCLATLKDYLSLMQMAQEAHLPMFKLKAAHGVFGSHSYAVQRADDDFTKLAKIIAEKIPVSIPILNQSNIL